MKDVEKMKTLYKELPYLAALSNMFSSQWQLNCHMKSHMTNSQMLGKVEYGLPAKI